MKGSTLITVIVPCYNIENLIVSTVKTICNQSYQNLEIILVNDGSEDSTANVLDELAKTDNRIRIIHKENGGVTSARLEGVRSARGEWIGFVDGDDAIDPDMYERLLKNAIESKADISHCGYRMVFPSHVDYYYNTGLRAEHDKITGLQELLSGSRIEPGLCNKLFHKSLFHSLLHDGKMDLSIKNMEDLLMNFYLFQEANKSVYEDFCPYHYMVRENSAATGKGSAKKLEDPLKVFSIIRENVSGNDDLYRAVNSRLAGQLIGISTMRADKNDLEIRSLQAKSRRDLKAMLPELMKPGYSWKTKALSCWAVFSPKSYHMVHALYAKLRGTDKKYNVE